MRVEIDSVHETPDGLFAARIGDRWFLADAHIVTPDEQDMLRVNDAWFLPDALVQA